MPSYRVFEIPETRSPDLVDVVVADPTDRNSRCFTHYAYTIGSSERQWPRLAERRAIDFSLLRNWQDFRSRQAEAFETLKNNDEYWPGRSALSEPEDTHHAHTAMRLGALEILANLFSGRIAANDKDPFPHQLALQQFMRAQQGLQRVLIADEVGLGKTIEIGLVLRDLLISRGSLDRFSCLYLTSGGLVEDACTKLRDVMRGSLDGQAVVEPVDSFRRYGTGNTRGVHVGSLHAARLYTTVARKAALPSARIAPEIVVIDECHHCASETDLSSVQRLQLAEVTRSYQAAFQLVTGTFWPNSEPPKLVVLMSATPFRSRTQFLNLLKLLTHGIHSEQNPTPFNAYEPGINPAKLAAVLRRPESAACVIWRQQNDTAVRRWNGKRLFPNLRIVRPHKTTDATPVLAAGDPAYLARMEEIERSVVRISKAHGVSFGGFAIAQLEKKLTSSSLAGACWLFTWCVRHCAWTNQKEFEADSSPGTEMLRRLIVEISQRLASFSKNPARHADVVFPSEGFSFAASSLARPGRISDIYRYWNQMREVDSDEAKGFVASPEEIVEIAGHGLALLRPDVDEGGTLPDATAESAFGIENAKLNWMQKMLESYPTERFVVFTESLQTCAIITSALPRSGQLVGSMGTEARNDVVGRFRSGHLRVLVATSAADEGIDLQVSNRVVHWDLSTSPAVLMQRNGRVARLGQVADVTAYYLIVTGTHEERRDQVLADRFTALGIQDESLRLKILGTLQEEEEERLASAIDSNQQIAVGDILKAAKRDTEEMERELKLLRTSLDWHYVLDRDALAVRLERWDQLGLPEAISTELRFSEKKWSRPVFGDVATSEPAIAKIATLESGDLRQKVTFDPEYQVFAATDAKEFRLAGLRPWTRRDNDTAGFTKLRPDVTVDLLGDLCGKLARIRHGDFSLISASTIRTSVPRIEAARWLLFATHPMREAETDQHEGQARYLTCYPFNDDLEAPIVPEGLTPEEVDRVIQALELEACEPSFQLDENARLQAAEVGKQLGLWLSRTRSLGGGAIFDDAKYFLPIPVALIQIVTPGERPAIVGSASKLARSSDPLDRLGSALLRRCLVASRVTLADALRLAEEQNRSEIEAYAALQRLINPESTALVRYFVEHGERGARVLTTDQLQSHFARLTDSPDEVKTWMANVEVVWSSPSLGGLFLEDDR